MRGGVMVTFGNYTLGLSSRSQRLVGEVTQ